MVRGVVVGGSSVRLDGEKGGGSLRLFIALEISPQVIKRNGRHFLRMVISVYDDSYLREVQWQEGMDRTQVTRVGAKSSRGFGFAGMIHSLPQCRTLRPTRLAFRRFWPAVAPDAL